MGNIHRVKGKALLIITAKRSLIKLPVLTKRNPVLILVTNHTLSPPPQMLSEFFNIPNVHTFLSFHDNLHAHTQMPFPSNESGDV